MTNLGHTHSGMQSVVDHLWRLAKYTSGEARDGLGLAIKILEGLAPIIDQRIEESNASEERSRKILLQRMADAGDVERVPQYPATAYEPDTMMQLMVTTDPRESSDA
jgi:hypothetical protein